MAAAQKWKCEVCGYIHEGPEPPDVCPVCGVGPEMFTAFSEEEPAVAAGAGAWRCGICSYVETAEAPPEICPVCGAAASLFVPEEASAAVAAEPTGDSIVVIGGGAAAFTAVEAARRVSTGVRITLIHKEPDLPYNRLNLTRLLAGEVGEEALPLKSEGWYHDHQIETVPGEVVEIDRSSREVVLRDGQRVTYHRLLLANGSHAFVPPILGATRAGVLSLRTRQDALTILDRVRDGSRCVCIGGGLLGLETAGALAGRGVEVTVVEGFDWLLPRQLAEPAARLLEKHIANLGVRVVCGVRTEEITGDEEARGVKIKDGDELAADLVVLATGVRPNSHLARSSGLEVNKGVVVDDYMQTSDPAIYAAGDVSEHRGVVFGLWPIALGQGAVAGANLAGGNSQTFTGVTPPTQLKVLDVAMFSIGDFDPRDGSFRVFEHQREHAYYRLVCRDGQVVGANLFGDTESAGVIKTAVEEGKQLDEVRAELERFENLSDCLSD